MESTDPLLQLGVGAAVAVFIVSKFLEWAPRIKALLKHDKSGNPEARTAGEHPPEYWQIEQRKAVADVVKPLIEGQNSILLQIADNGKDQAVALRELTQEIREDRAVERGRREARKGAR